MNSAEARLIEKGWTALVERLGLAEATRFVMLLDRRTGSARKHLYYIQSGVSSQPHHYNTEASHFAHNDDATNTGTYG